MAWYITIHVTDCATGAALSNAIANDGVTNSSPAGPTGNITLEINDEGESYGIQVICFGYHTKQMTLQRSQAGTVQNICLDKAPPTSTCFIVTAATGSATSEEIVRLRRLRDDIVSTTDLGRRLVEAIYAEYGQFSPAIAERVASQTTLRGAVRAIYLQPLLAWFGLLEALWLRGAEPEVINGAAEAVRRACREAGNPAQVTALLQNALAGRVLSWWAPSLPGELAAAISVALQRPFAAWALIDPLMRAWETTASNGDMREQALAWLAQCPLHRLEQPGDLAALDRDLAELSATVLANPHVRQSLGARLAPAWPAAGEILRRHGFV